MNMTTVKVMILSLLFLGSSNLTMGQTYFGSERVISNFCGGASSVFACDIDGDNDIDVLAAASAENKIVWYENDGTGNFGPQQVITTSARIAVHVYACDMDGDGDIDVFSASSADNKIAWYENDGTGNFGEQQVISDSAYEARAVYACDIDEDGDIDVLSASSGDNKIVLYKNDGAENFEVQIMITDSAENACSVYACDIEQDADLDILSASFEDHKIALYVNDGYGYFDSQQFIIAKASGVRSVYACDIDLDGDNDILAAAFNEDKICWYENYDGEHFSTEKVITTSASGTVHVYACDIDGDLDYDVLSASYLDHKIAWYENDGYGNFGQQQVITTSARFAKSVYASDIDGDGDLDLLSASSGDHKIAWYENSPPPQITEQPADQNCCVNSNTHIQLSVDFAESYLWQVDAGSGFSDLNEDAVYSGVYTNDLLITSPTVDMSGNLYRCIVTNQEGDSISESAMLTINSTALITSQPAPSTKVCQDESDIILEVIADGALGYQWYFEGEKIAEATSSTFSITTDLSNSGNYYCEVQCGNIQSNDAVVLIQPATAVTSQPAPNTKACEGITDIILDVEASGTGTITYQWNYEGSEIDGAINSTVSISADPEKSGTYSCTVASECGNAITDDAEVTIHHAYLNTETELICSGSDFTFPDNTTQTNITLQMIYTSHLQTFSGCDSIIETTVNIYIVDNSVTTDGLTLIANTTATSYQWIDCNNNNAPVLEATNQHFTPTSDGDYAVIINDGTCIDTSLCYPITVTGVLDIADHGIAIYPNPTNGIISIEGAYIREIELKNINGQSLMILEINKEKVDIDLSSQTSGVYFIEISTNTGVTMRKIVVN